jgi:hypothetical protein
VLEVAQAAHIALAGVAVLDDGDEQGGDLRRVRRRLPEVVKELLVPR